MQFLISLIAKVPKGFRFPVLIVAAVIGFFLAVNGYTNGIVWQAVVGTPILLAVVVTFYAIIDGKAQL